MTTRLTGRITIDPPMRWAACRTFEESRLDRPIAVEVDSQFSFTDDGEETIRRGVAIVPLVEWQGHVKLSQITAHIKEIVDAALAAFHATLFDGEIVLDDGLTVVRYCVSRSGDVISSMEPATFESTSNKPPEHLPSILVEAITKPSGRYVIDGGAGYCIFTRAEIDPSSDQWILLHGVNDQYNSSPIAVRVSSITRVSRVKREEERCSF